MKKITALLLVFLMMLIMSACQPAGIPDETAPSTENTAPTSQPTETTLPETMPSETAPTEPEFTINDLWIFQYKEGYGDQLPFTFPDTSNCVAGHLYYFFHTNTINSEVQVICDEPVICFNEDNNNLYFVKEAEPTKLYSAPLTDMTQQTVFYESDFGTINDIYAETIGAYENTLVLTEGNKRGVLLDLITGETEVFIEQYYIEVTCIEDMQEVDGKRTYNKIWFRGKPEEDSTQGEYLYYADTGKVIISPYL